MFKAWEIHEEIKKSVSGVPIKNGPRSRPSCTKVLTEEQGVLLTRLSTARNIADMVFSTSTKKIKGERISERIIRRR